VAPGGGAQVPAGVQAVEQLKPEPDPRGDLDRFPQAGRAVLDAARPRIRLPDPGQQLRQVFQVASVTEPGQRRRADSLGGVQVRVEPLD
jgi:hypothetical protein